ncbi:hypothetical protein [Jeotgalibacillus sp. JSM ZJ347]|uniref:5-methylcytosine restriction system specificity protein McrC n=1 Tax=Jeotgalibacillus sp. JSM ZJ347 TaxID=3342117 RepID=UPI0035A911AB
MKKFNDDIKVLNQPDNENSLYIQGEVKPDIIICAQKNDKVVAVLDAKYKRFKRKEINPSFVRSDRLQILAYGLIYNPYHIGHIFPGIISGHHLTQEVTNSNIVYHEMVLGADSNQETDICLDFLDDRSKA